MRGKPMVVAIGLVALASGWARADSPRRDPGPARGEHVARLVCSACHVVADNQEFPPLLNPPAPSFKALAHRPATTPESVRHFVLTTHWDPPYDMPLRMPNPMLLSAEADDVARYLLSLRKVAGDPQPSAPTAP